jgi:hypothetical protein
MPDPANASPTDWAAWIGAATGSAALIWEVVKHFREGARLLVDVQTNVFVMSPTGRLGEVRKSQNLTKISVSNVGDRATTVEGVYGTSFRRNWFCRRIDQDGLFVTQVMTAAGKELPCVIQPGEQWTGLMEQHVLEADHRAGKTIRLGVHHSSAKKGVFVPVTFRLRTVDENAPETD